MVLLAGCSQALKVRLCAFKANVPTLQAVGDTVHLDGRWTAGRAARFTRLQNRVPPSSLPGVCCPFYAILRLP